MAVDLCVEVDENTGIKAGFEDKTYYFCSNHCKQTFEKKPEKYAERGCVSHHQRFYFYFTTIAPRMKKW